MYHFQSLFKLEICGQPPIKFEGYEYDTEDEAIANRIRNNSRFGQDVWEVDKETLEEQAREALSRPVQKKRGRPLKTQIVTGIRTSELSEKQ